MQLNSQLMRATRAGHFAVMPLASYLIPLPPKTRQGGQISKTTWLITGAGLDTAWPSTL
jgi:hypothetical protein